MGKYYIDVILDHEFTDDEFLDHANFLCEHVPDGSFGTTNGEHFVSFFYKGHDPFAEIERRRHQLIDAAYKVREVRLEEAEAEATDD